VHATLLKRGLAVARCSLEDVQPFRILEVPLWMFDAAVCCRIRAAESSVVTVESLRELKALLRSSQATGRNVAIQIQHRDLLNAGGADVVVKVAETHTTGVVCTTRSETGLARTLTRDSPDDSAITDHPIATTRSKVGRRSDLRGGVR